MMNNESTAAPEQQRAMSIEIGTKVSFVNGNIEGCIALTLEPEVGEALTAYLSAADAADLSMRLTMACNDITGDMFLYAYFLMIIRQNQPDMTEESKHQLASKQVINIRQFRKSMEDAAAAGIPHDTAIAV